MKVEYRIREVTTYELSRFNNDGVQCGSTPIGCYERKGTAELVRRAMEASENAIEATEQR